MQTSKNTRTWLVEILYTCGYSALATACAYALLRYWGVTYWPFYAVLGIWVCLEVLFFAVQRLRYHRFNRVNRNRPDAQDIEQRFQNFLTLSPILDIRDFISGWFLNIPFDQIKSENVSDFIAYAYWYRPRHELQAEEQERVQRYTAEIARAWNIKFPPGSNPELQLMGHLWEPLKVVHKPLFVHIASEVSVLLTHLALQGLKFERYECMGFTYWASGLERPVIEDHEAPTATGRLSVLQSVLADIRSLLQTEADLPAAHGPLDFFTAQAQGFAEYQRRLNESLAAIMRPDALAGALPVMPGWSAGLAALSERLPSMPSMASLPRLPSMAELGRSKLGPGGPGVTGHRRSGSSLPAFLSISDLSRLPAFRDLDDMGHFDDLLGSDGAAASLPGLSVAAAAASAAATAARGSLGTLPSFGFAAALRESFTELRDSFSDLTDHMAAARGTLAAALPVMNLPDWHLPDWGAHTPRLGAGETWQQRLGSAITRTVEWAELDAMFAGLYDTPAAGDPHSATAGSVHPCEAAGGGAPTQSGESVLARPASAAAAAARSGIIQAWVESARATLARGAANFSGFSLPAPSELMELLPPRPQLARAHGKAAHAAPAAVDPDAAAALRRRVEGSIMTRSASAASLDTAVPHGVMEAAGTPGCVARQHSTRRSGGLPSAVPALFPSGQEQLTQSLTRQRALRRLVLGDRRGLRRTRSDPGPIFPLARHSATCPQPTHPFPTMGSDSAPENNGAVYPGIGAGTSPGVHATASNTTSPAKDFCASPTRPASGSSRRDELHLRAGLRHSIDTLCTPPRQRSARHCAAMCDGSPDPPFPVLPCPSSAASVASLPLPQSAFSRHGMLAEAPSPAPRVSSACVLPDAEEGVTVQESPHAGRVQAAPAVSGRRADATAAAPPGLQRSGLKPIVFLHGVGFGVFPYLGFVWKLLRAFPGRPFVLLEVRSVSLRLCMRAVGVDDVVRALATVLRRHRVTAANFVGHSFGTFVVAHMRKLFPETVSSVLLCDPVCMLTCFPKLLYNFIYRGFSIRDVLDNPAEAARWLAARDLTIAATFCRHFWWHTLMLWPWELPEPSVLVLSTKDALVPSELVRKQLHSGGVDWESGGQVKVLERSVYHGHFLFMPKWQDTIVETFRAALLQKEGAEKVADGAAGTHGAEDVTHDVRDGSP